MLVFRDYQLNMELLCLVLLVIGSINSVHSVTTKCVNNEDCLYKELFKNYNRNVRPVIDTNMTVEVNVSLVVNSLIDIEEKDQNMVTVGFFRVTWIDEFLTWDQHQYGGLTHLILTADLIWLPDIAISNSASKFYDITYKRDFHVHISSNGKVRWSFGGIFASNCNINLKQYPFDSQSCYIEIENWMYTISDVNLSVTAEDQIDTTQIGPNAVWNLTDTKAERRIKYVDFASLRFILVWQRKTLYYYVNIVIPIVLMLVVALGVFWLPAECGEKMSLAITIVLAFSVFQIIIMDNTPVNSDVVPEITELVMLVMALATTALLSSMVAVYISGKSTKRRAPRWLRTLCFGCLARMLCMTRGIPYPKEKNKRKTSTTISNDGYHNNENCGNYYNSINSYGIEDSKSNKTAGVPQQGDEDFTNFSNTLYHGKSFRSSNITNGRLGRDDQISSLCSSISKIHGMLEEKEGFDFIKNEWKYIAQIVDRLAFWITLFIMLGCITFIFA